MSGFNALAEAVSETGDFFLRYVKGFDDGNATAQTPGLPNHLVWTLGHLALYMHRASELITQTEVELGWDPEPFAFGSATSDDPSAYPDLATMLRRFNSAVDALTTAVGGLPAGGLDRQIQWGGPGATISVRDLVLRMVFHNGTHCGQIIDLRRGLGLGRVLGP